MLLICPVPFLDLFLPLNEIRMYSSAVESISNYYQLTLIVNACRQSFIHFNRWYTNVVNISSTLTLADVKKNLTGEYKGVIFSHYDLLWENLEEC